MLSDGIGVGIPVPDLEFDLDLESSRHQALVSIPLSSVIALLQAAQIPVPDLEFDPDLAISTPVPDLDFDSDLDVAVLSEPMPGHDDMDHTHSLLLAKRCSSSDDSARSDMVSSLVCSPSASPVSVLSCITNLHELPRDEPADTDASSTEGSIKTPLLEPANTDKAAPEIYWLERYCAQFGCLPQSDQLLAFADHRGQRVAYSNACQAIAAASFARPGPRAGSPAPISPSGCTDWKQLVAARRAAKKACTP